MQWFIPRQHGHSLRPAKHFQNLVHRLKVSFADTNFGNLTPPQRLNWRAAPDAGCQAQSSSKGLCPHTRSGRSRQI